MLCNSKFFRFCVWFGGVVMIVFGVHTLFFLELPEGRHIAPFLATSIANICGGIPLIYLITSSIPKWKRAIVYASVYVLYNVVVSAIIRLDNETTIMLLSIVVAVLSWIVFYPTCRRVEQE
ncbi:hypothetical protein DST30_11370 [Salmonella enterica subsp. enterica serovar Panama]|nr:hypothetical protein [Salmonella enterica subsp. enterica serovar Panama]